MKNTNQIKTCHSVNGINHQYTIQLSLMVPISRKYSPVYLVHVFPNSRLLIMLFSIFRFSNFNPHMNTLHTPHTPHTPPAANHPPTMSTSVAEGQPCPPSCRRWFPPSWTPKTVFAFDTVEWRFVPSCPRGIGFFHVIWVPLVEARRTVSWFIDLRIQI